ncbi:MAG TPA: hypothetical protein VKA01_02070 [Vicinamibacteria bacterium]|nr:hypothetical protein [Vicinamibacteria bacterium]
MNRVQRRARGGRRVAAAVLAYAMLLDGGATLAAQQQVVPPQPTVPEVFTLMGQYVRVAYNNRGFVTLGYRVAQQAVGEEWALLEVGLTVRSGDSYTLKREHLSIKTPDGSTIGLATQKEYAEAGYLPALNNRAKVVRDSIDYFPATVSRPCAVQFFANLGQGARQLAYDQVELSQQRACVGRLYFKVPGGIKVGQHWLIVNFGDSEVQVPFRILTKEEQKEFSKTWEDIKKAHEATLQ